MLLTKCDPALSVGLVEYNIEALEEMELFVGRLIVLNETDKTGWQQARPLMINTDQIRSVEQLPTVNALSDTVSRITLINPETFQYDDVEQRTMHVEHIVFEKVSEIEALTNGVIIKTDYAERKHQIDREME